MKEKVLISWSGGKDCALALYETLKTGKYEISALLTTVTEDYDRISMHGVRRVLLEQQADSLGLPLEKVLIPAKGSNEGYETAIRDVLERHAAAGVTAPGYEPDPGVGVGAVLVRREDRALFVAEAEDRAGSDRRPAGGTGENGQQNEHAQGRIHGTSSR